MSNAEHNGALSHDFSWETIRLALQSDGEGIYEWDVTQGTIKYSSHCLELMGIKAQDNTAPNIFTEWDQVIVKEDRAHFDSMIRRYLEGYSEMPFRIETRLQNPLKSSWRWVRITGIAIRNAQLKPIRVIGAFVDITRRKTAEAQLEEERHLFRLLIDHIPDNIFFKNRESRFVVANASTAQKLKVPTPSDLIGRTDESFFDKALVSKWRQEEVNIMETGKPIIAQLTKEIWRNKQDTWCLSTKLPWRGKTGQLKGILGITSDVTMMMHTQQALKAIAAKLEEKNQALEKEMRLAREVQLALLPQQVPSIKVEHEGSVRCLEFAHKYQASGDVAGDWFEVFPITHTTVGVFICDVMGHGVRSALVAFMIRGLLEEAVRENPQPKHFLQLVNNKLTRILARSDATMFATALYLLIDLENKKITYSSAGHLAPFIMRPNAPTEELLLPKAMALGLLEHRVYEESEIFLEEGMSLLLYTDGLFEANNKIGEELGKTRIKNYLSTHIPKSASDIVTNALNCAYNFTGATEFMDDICLLSLKFHQYTAPLT